MTGQEPTTDGARDRRVVVVGGGITGLATAWLLDRAGVDVTLLEAAERLGGKLWTGEVAGEQAELGADAFLARNPAAQGLARRVGLGDDLVAPATGQVWLWNGGRLRRLPTGTVLGCPDRRDRAGPRGVLSPAAVVRAGMDPGPAAAPRRGGPVGGRRRGGAVRAAVVDTLVEPLLGGVYAGRPDQLSVEPDSPDDRDAAREHGRLLGLRGHRAASAGADGPVFLTLAHGLARLADGSPTTSATASTGAARCRSEREPTAAAGRWHRRRLATSPTRSCWPRRPSWPPTCSPASPADAAAELAGIPYASVAVVTLAYDRSADASCPRVPGMLVPRTEGRLVKASTWVSRKWPHRDAGDHAARARQSWAGSTTSAGVTSTTTS